MQKPSIGWIVIVPRATDPNNGANEAPAVITRVWSERADGGWTVNVRVLLDSDAVTWRTSVALFDTEEAARAVAGEHCAWWPPRV